jgi:hypothetical protein
MNIAMDCVEVSRVVFWLLLAERSSENISRNRDALPGYGVSKSINLEEEVQCL